ncbi:MAG: hypothetical protein RR363_08265, partial [Rikenellaceae bacterium]
MNKYLIRISTVVLIFICYTSSTYAQGYVDDLYYNKNNESHQRQTVKRSSYTKDNNYGAKPWQQTLADEGKESDETVAASSDDYYPGMFAEAVGKNNSNNEYVNNNKENDYQPSWYNTTVYVTCIPSWYLGFGFGANPYYYNPWMASSYYGGYWGNPWMVGYP